MKAGKTFKKFSPRLTARAFGRLLTLIVLALLAGFFRHWGPLGDESSSIMLLGFLLLAAFVSGEVARELRLPRITGYLAIGILFGPSVFGLLPRTTVEAFKLINDIALSVIALQAGGELSLSRLRKRLGAIAGITVSEIAVVGAGTAAVAYLGRDLLPFLAGQPDLTVLAVAIILGLTAAAMSPATTIAVLTELRARGPLTDTVLSVSVLADVLILLLIAVVVPGAVVMTDPTRGFDFHELQQIAVAIVVALLLGALVGGLMILYLHRIQVMLLLAVLGVAFGVVELAHVVGLHSESYILMSMAAGFVARNFSPQGERFIEALDIVSLPIYALFFAVAGAALDLGVIPAVWQACLLLLLARTAFLGLGAQLGARATRDLPVVRRYAWLGFVAQAGVALGLASVVEQRFALWGGSIGAIIVGVIAVNQLVGPPLFRFSLVRAGESEQRQGRVASWPSAEPPRPGTLDDSSPSLSG